MNDILEKFILTEKIISITENKIGLINTTYIANTQTNRYVLQRINDSIFSSPNDLMENIYLVTKHLEAKGHKTIEIVRSKKNQLYTLHQDQYWRVFKYIDGKIFQEVNNIKIVSASAIRLARFHRDLKDFTDDNLKEIIPDFHNTIIIFKEFQNILKNSSQDLLNQCVQQINYILEKEKECYITSDLLKNNRISLQICHNDPKISNFLFDDQLNAISLIDLDTVFFGTVITDIADAIRTICVSESEEESDINKLYFKYDYFECFISSYLRVNQKSLNSYELNSLAKTIELIYLEQGIRFLTDYLNGNKYFLVSYQEQNLVRANNQLHLSKEISKNLEKINNIVNRHIK